MAYEFKTRISKKSNYGGSRSVSAIKFIVIHYTGNDGDTDESNGNYFTNNIVKASAHYFVDDDSVTQSVPDNYIAWSVGGSKYGNCATTGGGRYYGICTNSNSISIEICDDVKNGIVYPSEKTIENAVELTKMLMNKYGIAKSNVIRHFDVTGKSCPAYWCGNVLKNEKWETEFLSRLVEEDFDMSLLKDLADKYGEDAVKSAVESVIVARKDDAWKVQGSDYLHANCDFSDVHCHDEPVTFGVLGTILSKLRK